jgi:hypothetical protein
MGLLFESEGNNVFSLVSLLIYGFWSHAGPLDLSIQGLTTKEKLSLDFDLTKTCAKFHPKRLTPSVSNPAAKNPPVPEGTKKLSTRFEVSASDSWVRTSDRIDDNFFEWIHF